MTSEARRPPRLSERLHRRAHPWLLAQQRLHSGEFVGADIHQEYVGQAACKRRLQIADDRALHQEDCENQHHACTQRGEYS